jgi:hypothetical protein
MPPSARGGSLPGGLSSRIRRTATASGTGSPTDQHLEPERQRRARPRRVRHWPAADQEAESRADSRACRCSVDAAQTAAPIPLSLGKNRRAIASDTDRRWPPGRRLPARRQRRAWRRRRSEAHHRRQADPQAERKADSRGYRCSAGAARLPPVSVPSNLELATLATADPGTCRGIRHMTI